MQLRLGGAVALEAGGLHCAAARLPAVAQLINTAGRGVKLWYSVTREETRAWSAPLQPAALPPTVGPGCSS